MIKMEWIVVGGGVAGISIAEVLTRSGHSVLLIEKNEKLASETSGIFHEWYHTGCLYTLLPKSNETLSYLLGGVDDMIEYFGGYCNNNIVPTENGLELKRCYDGNNWFNDEKINFKYNYDINILWNLICNRSIENVEKIKEHDWLRRRAGAMWKNQSRKSLIKSFNNLEVFNFNRERIIESQDFSMNSRNLLKDLVSTILGYGSKILVNEAVLSVNESNGCVTVVTDRGKYYADNCVIATPDWSHNKNIKNLALVKSYSPMIVAKTKNNVNNFVNLHWKIGRCINRVNKPDGYVLLSGVSFNRFNEEELRNYSNYVFEENKKYDESLEFAGEYLGVKKELLNTDAIRKKINRNYIYTINSHTSKIYGVSLGKFSLFPSLAVEFYRRFYKSNPSKNVISKISQKFTNQASDLISKCKWETMIKKEY